MLKILAICAAMPGCLYTDVEGDPRSTGEPLVRQRCYAVIECAPRIDFEWCASFGRHVIDAETFVHEHWIASGCPTDVNVTGGVFCDTGGSICFARGLVGVESD